jgi:hypothetical protein
MRTILHQLPTAVCIAVLTVTAATAQNSSSNSQPGDVIQSVPPPVSQKPQPPPLNLTNDQRAKIKQVLRAKNTEVTFQLKATKPAQSFDPAPGAKIPKGLKPHSLPPPLIYEMPVLKHYTYLKLKGQVVIVNPMTGKIVDMFSET